MPNIKNLNQRKPIGASCNFIKEAWSTIYGSYYNTIYWSTFTTSLTTLLSANPSTSYGTFGNLVITRPYGLDVLISVTFPNASWISGGIVGRYWVSSLVNLSCGTTTPNTYVTAISGDEVIIDVWKALQDGLWSSSVQFTVQVTAPVLTIGQLRARAGQCGLPFSFFNYTTFPGISCGVGGIVKTVTVYDDGRITIT